MSLAVQYPEERESLIGEIVIPESAIERRVGELAACVSRDYAGREPVLLAILKGAWVFACDLARRLEVPAVLETAAITRYRRSPGYSEVRMTQEPGIPLAGRDVLLIEDIVDTGLTLRFLIQRLEEQRPSSITVCSFLDRPTLRLAEIPLRYVGFNVADDFLIGYGLDYREQFRNLPYIAALHDRSQHLGGPESPAGI